MTPPEQHSPGIIAPPPVLYLGASLVGLVCQSLSPLPLASSGSGLRVPAGLIFGVSVFFVYLAFREMRASDTSANPYQRVRKLVTSGPFAVSRNPIYLAMSGFYLALTLLVNSWWLPVTFLPLIWLMHWGVIYREEHYLLALFGQEYTDYKQRVRRWL